MGLESTPKSLLEGFRKQHSPVDRELLESPPVSRQLIAWLDKAFPRETDMVNDPLMSQKLTVRFGMDIILDHLRRTNGRQEAGAISVYDASNPVPPR